MKSIVSEYTELYCGKCIIYIRPSMFALKSKMFVRRTNTNELLWFKSDASIEDLHTAIEVARLGAKTDILQYNETK